MESSPNDEVVFYPNPTTGRLYFKDIKENITIQVLDLKGQIIQQVNSSQGYFDFENVSNGIYVVRYYDSRSDETKSYFIGLNR